MELRGRSVLVTGATGELGRAIALRLRGEGCALTVSGPAGEGVEALAEEVEGRGVVGELGHRGEVERVVGAAGDVDVLVVGGGAAAGGDVAGYAVDEIDRVLDTALRAPLVLARLVGERMLARGTGHVVFVSSLAGKAAGGDGALLTAATFGLRGFALGLRQDWGPRGVGVSCVNVGPVGAPVTDTAAQPAGFRPKTADDVAAAVVRAVRHDRAEVDVADPVRRVGVLFGQVAPRAAARLHRLGGSREPL